MTTVVIWTMMRKFVAVTYVVPSLSSFRDIGLTPQIRTYRKATLLNASKGAIALPLATSKRRLKSELGVVVVYP